MKKLWTGVVVVVAFIVLAAFISMPDKLAPIESTPDLPEDLDSWLAVREAAAPYPLVPGTEKRIRWQSPGERTEYVVVYLHGFSATRQEIAPAPEQLADALGANLFDTRLAGHGRQTALIENVTAEDWLVDGAEALAIAERLGDKIILITVSTGSTLAVALADHPLMAKVDTLIMMAPNFSPADTNARHLTGPGGPILASLILGDTRSWEPKNAEQALYWSTEYPTTSTIEVMRLVDLANAQLPLATDYQILTFLSQHDNVVSTPIAEAALEQITAPTKTTIMMNRDDGAGNHILAGDIIAPEETEYVVGRIARFILDRE